MQRRCPEAGGGRCAEGNAVVGEFVAAADFPDRRAAEVAVVLDPPGSVDQEVFGEVEGEVEVTAEVVAVKGARVARVVAGEAVGAPGLVGAFLAFDHGEGLAAEFTAEGQTDHIGKPPRHVQVADEVVEGSAAHVEEDGAILAVFLGVAVFVKVCDPVVVGIAQKGFDEHFVAVVGVAHQVGLPVAPHREAGVGDPAVLAAAQADRTVVVVEVAVEGRYVANVFSVGAVGEEVGEVREVLQRAPVGRAVVSEAVDLLIYVGGVAVDLGVGGDVGGGVD